VDAAGSSLHTACRDSGAPGSARRAAAPETAGAVPAAVGQGDVRDADVATGAQHRVNAAATAALSGKVQNAQWHATPSATPSGSGRRSASPRQNRTVAVNPASSVNG